MASSTQWTWVWVNSVSWWWTGRPGMLQSMGSQGVGHDWATELNWTEKICNSLGQKSSRHLVALVWIINIKALMENINIKWSESHSVMCDSFQLHGLYSPRNSPGQNTGVRSLSLLQGIFPTQGWNPGVPHCRWILYQLSLKGSPRILKWVACSFSSGSS